MDSYNHLPELSGTAREQAWLRERLETLSVREGIILSAVLARQPPESAADAINRIQGLDDYEVCFPAGNHEQLGKFYLHHEAQIPEDALPYVDVWQIGQQYEEEHPGQFVGNCFVVYPGAERKMTYSGQSAPLPEDRDWSVKLKLASPSVPEGVWLRLPDYTGAPGSGSVETALALDRLCARDLTECTLLDVQCVLPEAGSLKDQYENIAELIQDGNNLGFVLDEQGQGEALWMERFAAALEFEGCHSLRFALDISQNLQCYEYVPYGNLEPLAEEHLRAAGVSEMLLHSGCIDLHGYAEDLLETSGYMLTGDESGYVTRNTREFVYEFSEDPSAAEMTME